jgi:hypothetical protein
MQVWPGGRPWRTGDVGATENEGIREKKEMEKIKKMTNGFHVSMVKEEKAQEEADT